MRMKTIAIKLIDSNGEKNLGFRFNNQFTLTYILVINLHNLDKNDSTTANALMESTREYQYSYKNHTLYPQAQSVSRNPKSQTVSQIIACINV